MENGDFGTDIEFGGIYGYIGTYNDRPKYMKQVFDENCDGSYWKCQITLGFNDHWAFYKEDQYGYITELLYDQNL